MSELTRRYGQALFEVCENHQNFEQVINQANELKSVFKDHTIMGFLTDINVDKQRKIELIENSFENILPILKNFVLTLIVNKRLPYYDEIISDTKQIYREHHKISLAKVKSAYELDDKLVRKLQEALEKKYNKKVELTISLDSSLINGIRVEIENDVLDNSVLTQIQKLSSFLKNGGNYEY